MPTASADQQRRHHGACEAMRRLNGRAERADGRDVARCPRPTACPCPCARRVPGARAQAPPRPTACYSAASSSTSWAYTPISLLVLHHRASPARACCARERTTTMPRRVPPAEGCRTRAPCTRPRTAPQPLHRVAVHHRMAVSDEAPAPRTAQASSQTRRTPGSRLRQRSVLHHRHAQLRRPSRIERPRRAPVGHTALALAAEVAASPRWKFEHRACAPAESRRPPPPRPTRSRWGKRCGSDRT